MRFYLGVHRAKWLEETDVPMMISRRRLAGRRRLPRAHGPWVLDSSAYTELFLHGRWTFEPAQYADEVRRFQSEIGNLEWASICDHMCEPWILKRTGSTVREHQQRTVTSYLELHFLAPEIPWVPVVRDGVSEIISITSKPTRKLAWISVPSRSSESVPSVADRRRCEQERSWLHFTTRGSTSTPSGSRPMGSRACSASTSRQPT
jgi:hypothetical protein